jgi:hypothetical protein
MMATSSTGGTICTLAVLMASSITMELVAVSFTGFSFCSSSMALIPIGVAAFPSPSTLAEMLRTIMPIAGWPLGSSGKSGRKTGSAMRTMMLMRPDLSAIRSIPSHSAITPIRPRTRVTAVLAVSIAALLMAVSLTNRTVGKVRVALARVSPGWAANWTTPRRSLSRSAVMARMVASGSGKAASLAKCSSRPAWLCVTLPA